MREYFISKQHISLFTVFPNYRILVLFFLLGFKAKSLFMYNSVPNHPSLYALPCFGAFATKHGDAIPEGSVFWGMSVFNRRGMPYGQGLGGTS